MKILVITRSYPPLRNPRAFRANELLRGLCERGISAGLIAPQGIKHTDDDLWEYHPVDYGGNYGRNLGTPKYSSLKKYIRKISSYFLGDSPSNILYSIHLFRLLLKKRMLNNYDALVVISYPFYNLVAVSFFVKIFSSGGCFIADCGDPLYYNTSFAKAAYLKWFERWVLKSFDYVTIPFDHARKAYQECIPQGKIRVIPQGFRIIDIPADMYIGNLIPTFCYAGVFYEQIRNPEFFFEHLMMTQGAFRFVVYALDEPFTQSLLVKYKARLKDRLVVVPPIDRESLIHEMAKMDFVINFDNDNATQRPSKLIDYAMSRRPILSFNRQTFRPEVFQAFLKGDYREQYHVDLAQYDIRRVVDQFEALVDEKIRGDVK